MLEQNNFYLVGIKGVAMTALAGCLLDLGKTVRGSDVAEDFPTKDNLQRLGVPIDLDFTTALPSDTQIVIFSGANGGSLNHQVQAAKKRGLPVFSHAQALAEIFNLKKGIAVCGVGGKSTISGMLAFISEQIQPQSYAVGVGEIIGLPRTGQFLAASDYFIAEADEYVADPAVKPAADQIIPRFHYLQPQIIICSNLRFDHPDVYRDLSHTKQIYLEFFQQLRPHGTLIFNGDDTNLLELAQQLQSLRPDVQQLTYGLAPHHDYCLMQFDFPLNLPGEFNRLNALAALAAAEAIGWSRPQILTALSTYRSVKRRFEFIGNLGGVECWDDYAHHPSEVAAAITAMQQWRPGQRLVVAFQSHTFSRTKQLFREFVAALALNPEIVLIDIFPSAREEFDDSISSDHLVQAIQLQHPTVKAVNLHTIANLRQFLQTQMKPGDVFLTLGAGDIYQVYQAK